MEHARFHACLHTLTTQQHISSKNITSYCQREHSFMFDTLFCRPSSAVILFESTRRCTTTAWWNSGGAGAREPCCPRKTPSRNGTKKLWTCSTTSRIWSLLSKPSDLWVSWQLNVYGGGCWYDDDDDEKEITTIGQKLDRNNIIVSHFEKNHSICYQVVWILYGIRIWVKYQYLNDFV